MMRFRKQMTPGSQSPEKNQDINPTNLKCQNCQETFRGHYCPNCGQAVREFDKPISFVFYNFLGDFFSFDTRFVKSFIYLLVRPGFLTSEFFKGRRVRYAPPIRIFIFVSFILFLLLQIYTNRGFKRVIDPSVIRGTPEALIDPVAQNSIDSVHFLTIPADSLMNNDNFKLDLNYETFRDATNLKKVLGNYADQLELKLKGITDPEEKASSQKIIDICRSPEQAATRILKYLSWTFFLLLPVFALILKVFYIRRNQFYMRHLIFSIHLHSFIFLVFTVITLLYYLIDRNLEFVSACLVLFIPVYFILALKRVYGQNLWKVIFKAMVITLIYNITAFSIVAIVVFKAFNLA